MSDNGHLSPHEPRISISSRRSIDTQRSGKVSHGRGGAGNIGRPTSVSKLTVDRIR
jgi:hypothetical protein